MGTRTRHFYEFDRFRIDAIDRVLLHDGKPINLAPKVYDTLLLLVRNSGHVLSKEELMRELWPDTFVEDGTLAQYISLLRKALADGPQRRYIETLPKRGYRFVAEVREQTQTEGGDAPKVIKESLLTGIHARRLVAIVATLAVALVPALYYFGSTGEGESTARPDYHSGAGRRVQSLAVLPFRNLSGESDEYLGDAVADALVTRLAGIPDLRVVSFSRTRRFRGSAVEPAAIGRQLGVDAVLSGTLHKSSGRLHFRVHLVESRSGFELWPGDSLDGDLINLLEVQRQLTDAIARRLRQSLTAGERARIAAAGTKSIEAYELFLRGKQLATRSAPPGYAGGTASQKEIGRRMLERAIQLDPDFADAHAWLAYSLWRPPRRNLVTGRVVIDEANRALALNPRSPAALMVQTLVAIGTGRAREALELGKQVLDANPDDLDAVTAAAEAYFYAGMLDRAIPLYRQALQADPSNLEFRSQLARCYLYSGEYQKGSDLLNPELESGDAGIWAMLIYSELGQFQKAMEVAALSTRNLPDQYVGWYFAGCVFAHAGRPDLARETWLKGVRNAEGQLVTAEHRGPRTFGGLMYAKLGMREKALEAIEHLLAFNPKHSEVLYFVCKIHAVLGNRREAIRYLKEAIANGFLNLGFVDYHRRPLMGLHSLDGDPEFQAIRRELATTVDQLRTRY